MKQFLMNAYNGRALTSVTLLPWAILATLVFISCEGSISPDATIVMDASTQVDASPSDERLIPGVWEGEMTGVMNNRAFTATVSLAISEQFQVTGTWAGQGEFADVFWEGVLRGTVDANGCFYCSSVELFNPSLCISKHNSVIGIFSGCLKSTTSTGTWDVNAAASNGFDGGPGQSRFGTGTWTLRHTEEL